jgi:hypothetical protein
MRSLFLSPFFFSSSLSLVAGPQNTVTLRLACGRTRLAFFFVFRFFLFSPSGQIFRFACQVRHCLSQVVACLDRDLPEREHTAKTQLCAQPPEADGSVLLYP